MQSNENTLRQYNDGDKQQLYANSLAYSNMQQNAAYFPIVVATKTTEIARSSLTRHGIVLFFFGCRCYGMQFYLKLDHSTHTHIYAAKT